MFKCLLSIQFYIEDTGKMGRQKYKNLELEDPERSSRRVVCGETNDLQR